MRTLGFAVWERAQTSAWRLICSHFLTRSLWPGASIQLRAGCAASAVAGLMEFERDLRSVTITSGPDGKVLRQSIEQWIVKHGGGCCGYAVSERLPLTQSDFLASSGRMRPILPIRLTC
jgi:hypothetical protein